TSFPPGRTHVGLVVDFCAINLSFRRERTLVVLHCAGRKRWSPRLDEVESWIERSRTHARPSASSDEQCQLRIEPQETGIEAAVQERPGLPASGKRQEGGAGHLAHGSGLCRLLHPRKQICGLFLCRRSARAGSCVKEAPPEGMPAPGGRL